jgi:hypothetical protein
MMPARGQGYLFWIVGLRLLSTAASDSAQIAELVASDAAADRFGWSVAIDGDTVVIGVPGNNTVPATPGSVYIFRADDGGATFAQVTTLTAVAADGQFGIAVAIDDDTVVVGSPYDDPGGSAYVFRTTDGATYGLVAKLTAADAAANAGPDAAKLMPAASDLFGWSVAIKQGTVVVGAYGKDQEVWDDMANLITQADMGLVYLFQTSDDGATWSPGNLISPSTGDQLGSVPASLPVSSLYGGSNDYAAGDAFGYSVAIFEYADSYDVWIHDPDLGPVLNTTTFTQNVIVVGGFSEAAYVYHGLSYYGTKLTADDSVDGDRFGWSVAIDGNTIVVGAPWDDNESGSAYVFLTYFGGPRLYLCADQWFEKFDQVAKLTATDAAAGDHFGWSVAVDGSTIVVGAYNAGTGGAVYVFRTTESSTYTTWRDCYAFYVSNEVVTYNQIAKLTAADAAYGDAFGISVAIAGTTVVVGARRDDAGSAYVFEIPPEPAPGPHCWILKECKTSSDAGLSVEMLVAIIVISLVLCCAAALAYRWRRPLARKVHAMKVHAMTPEQITKQKDKKMKQLQDLIDGNAVTVKDTQKEKWPPWLLKTEDCIDELLDELGADRQDVDIARARQIIADYASKKKGKESMVMPEGPLGSFTEFAGRDELKGDYYFANRAQRLHVAEKRSPTARARLEAECQFLRSRVHEAIEKELAGDEAIKDPAKRLAKVKERLRAVSDQATKTFSRIYESIYLTELDTAGERAKAAYDDAIQKLTPDTSDKCLQRAASVPALGASSAPPLVRASSAPALLVDALDIAPEFDKFVGRLTDAAGSNVSRKKPPPKGAARIVEKCALRPVAPDDTSKVCDVNRDMLVCKTLGDLTYLLEFIARAEDISVVRVKDRHNDPPPSKWRDVMVNIILKADHEAHHVCELQLCLGMMLTGREGLHGHTLYNRQRCADELLETLAG